MLYHHIGMVLYVAATLVLSSVPSMASSNYFPHNYFTYSPLARHKSSSYTIARSRRAKTDSTSDSITAIIAASRKQRVKKRSQKQEQVEETTQADSELSNLSYDDLGPLGKTIAGCTEIVIATLFDYCSGYFQGFLFGTLFGSPGFIFRPMEKGVRQPFMTEVSSRFSRMNTRSVKWAKNFGSITAAFGGFGVAVKVLRNGEKDAWNDIFSSAAAGAFFARKEGPSAMIRGALMYGGLIYFTSGARRNGQIQEFTEQPAIVDF